LLGYRNYWCNFIKQNLTGMINAMILIKHFWFIDFCQSFGT
jgi:hypothetical protein